MSDKFLCGVIIGMLSGAIISANCGFIRKAIKDGQSQLVKKVDKLNTDNSNNQASQVD